MFIIHKVSDMGYSTVTCRLCTSTNTRRPGLVFRPSCEPFWTYISPPFFFFLPEEKLVFWPILIELHASDIAYEMPIIRTRTRPSLLLRCITWTCGACRAPTPNLDPVVGAMPCVHAFALVVRPLLISWYFFFFFFGVYEPLINNAESQDYGT